MVKYLYSKFFEYIKKKSYSNYIIFLFIANFTNILKIKFFANLHLGKI